MALVYAPLNPHPLYIATAAIVANRHYPNLPLITTIYHYGTDVQCVKSRKALRCDGFATKPRFMEGDRLLVEQ